MGFLLYFSIIKTRYKEVATLGTRNFLQVAFSLWFFGRMQTGVESLGFCVMFGEMRNESSNARGYTYRWQKYRLTFLAQNPLCVFCLQQGKTEAATVVDHIKPHKGDMELFWDPKNHQALCTPCHAITKQRMENNPLPLIGLDGYPVEEGEMDFGEMDFSKFKK